MTIATGLNTAALSIKPATVRDAQRAAAKYVSAHISPATLGSAHVADNAALS